MLTDAERKILHTAWASGPSALMLAGYSADQIRDFLEREDVQAEMLALDREFKHSTGFDARARYLARRGLSQLSPAAIGMLARAMAGPQYMRGPDGEILRDARGYPIIREAELTPTQLRAAEIVVDAVGGKDAKGVDYRGDLQINMLIAADEKSVVIDHNQENLTPEQQALSRERMRNAIDRLMLRLPAVRDRVHEALGVRTIDTPQLPAAEKKPVKKRVKKVSDGSA